MKQASLVFIFLPAFFIVFGQPNKIKSIDSLMRAAHEICVFNGNVLVAQDKKIIYRAEIGFADTTRAKLLKPDQKFAIGLITKEFNSAGIILLQGKGKLNIHNKVSTYLPELPKWADEIEIKYLLKYTSGLPVLPILSPSGYFPIIGGTGTAVRCI